MVVFPFVAGGIKSGISENVSQLDRWRDMHFISFISKETRARGPQKIPKNVLDGASFFSLLDRRCRFEGEFWHIEINTGLAENVAALHKDTKI